MDTLRAIFLNEDFLLWFTLSILVLALALIGQHRARVVRRQAEQARSQAELEDLGGNSYFMPLPPVEQAVEIADPVEIDSLLSGESEATAAGVRRKLEEPTDISLEDEAREFKLALSGSPSVLLPEKSAAPAEPAPPVERRVEPAARPPVQAGAAKPVPATVVLPVPSRASELLERARAQAAAPARAVAAAAAPARAPTTEEVTHVPVRDLVLTWFEARGYRSSAADPHARPIELVLRHRKEPGRTYGFIAMVEPISTDQALDLLARARQAGVDRVLVASESDCDLGLTRLLRKQGVRVFDEASIRSELAKIEIRVAAKIIAVARGRAQARARFLQQKPEGRPAPERQPVLTAKF